MTSSREALVLKSTGDSSQCPSSHQTPLCATQLPGGNTGVHIGLWRQIAHQVSILVYVKLMAWRVPTLLFQPRPTYCCQ